MPRKARKRPGRGSDQFLLRFPDGMRDRIAADAAANERSMNAEIVERIEKPRTFLLDANVLIAFSDQLEKVLQRLDKTDEKLEALMRDLKERGKFTGE